MNAETPPTCTGDMSDLRLGIPGFSYADLHDVARLPDLLAAFETELERADPQLHERYRAYHDGGGQQLKPTELSALLIELAGHVSAFLARLFGVEQELAQYREHVRHEVATVYAFRAELVKRLPRAGAPPDDPQVLRDTVNALLRALSSESARQEQDRQLMLCEAGAWLLHRRDELAGEDATAASAARGQIDTILRPLLAQAGGADTQPRGPGRAGHRIPGRLVRTVPCAPGA